jgi:hypothetical protein
MKWYHYVSCFFAGVFLIHVVPHVMNGFSAKNVAGVVVSLGGGGLLLWAGKFSYRNIWAVIVVLLGMASVFVFLALRPHHDHENARAVECTGRLERSFAEISLGGGRLGVAGRPGRC